MGKSLMKGCSFILFLILLILILIGLATQGKNQCQDMDIVIVGDFSGSVQGKEAFVIDAINEFITSISGSGIRISVVLFADNPLLISDLSSNAKEGIDNINKYRDAAARGLTNIESALQMATNILLTEQTNSRKLIVLISDGDITVGTDESALFTAKQMNSIGIDICSVLIHDGSSDPEFMKMISSGCYAETDYFNLAIELKKLNICM